MGSARVESIGVVGGGVIGLSIAFELLDRDREVVLIDPRPGHGASWAAAGLLAPAAELAPGEAALLADLAVSASLWPRFAERVAADAGTDPGFRATGSILLGSTASDARDLARTVATMRAAAIDVVALSSDELASREPTIAPVRSSWLLPGDHSVDNRRLVVALLDSIKARGARIVEDRCTDVAATAGGLLLALESQGDVACDRVVLATGATPPPAGFAKLGVPLVRPVRGQTVRLAAVDGVAVPTSPIRAVVDGAPCYLVPRADGSMVVGATSEEQGFRPIATAGGVHRLLDAARLVFPALDELSFEEASVGFRPATPDHQPFVGRLHDPRVVAALGHYRNGILLAPLAARMAADLVLEASSCR